MRLLLTTALITSLSVPASAGSLKDRAGSVSYREAPAQVTSSALNSISIGTQLNSIEPAAGYTPSARVKEFSKGYGKNALEDQTFYDDLEPIEEPREYETYTDNSAIAPVPVLPQQTIPAPSSTIETSREKLKPRAELNHRFSNDRAITMGEFWVPLTQNVEEGSVLYGDVRIMGDNNDNDEYNAGLGYRELTTLPMLGEGVAGASLWYDRRLTKRGSKFSQVTAGAEWLGEDWDVRTNGYVPLNKDKTHSQENINGAGAGFAGNQLIVNTDQTVVEEALPGIDLEIGRRLDFMDGITDATRLYAGVYHFEGDRAEDVTGWRTRITSDITQDIQLGARFQDDDVRGSQTYLEATIRFPFGHKKSFREEGVYSRLDEAPERDIDIVSNEAITEAGVGQVLLNAQTGLAQNVIHVDNTNGAGTGTAEDPFNTLAAAQAAAGANDLIYVNRGDGTTTGMAAGITLDDAGQMLAGSGANLLFSGDRFRTSNGQDINGAAARLVTADTAGAPVITNGAGNGIDITADDAFVSGVTIDGATGDGIQVLNNSGSAWENAILENLITTNNARYGVEVLVDGVTSNISNVNLIGNAMNLNNFGGGLIQVENGGNIGQVVFKNNIANSNDNGFWVYVDGAGSNIEDVDFINNTANSNTFDGFLIESYGTSTLTDISLVDNVSVNNGRIGFNTFIFNSSLNQLTLDNNTATNSTQHGFAIQAFSNGTITQAVLSSNTASGNAINGISINDDSAAGSIMIDLGGGAFGSTGGNRSFGNTTADLLVDLDGAELKAENNWWGTVSGLLPAKLTLEDASTVDSTPFLTSDPN